MTQGDHWNQDDEARISHAFDILKAEAKAVAVTPDPLTAAAERKVLVALSAMDAAIEVHGCVARGDNKAAVLAMLRWADTLPKELLSDPEPPVEPAWRAICGVCDARWKITHDETGRVLTSAPENNPGPHGTFCPDCRQRGMIAPGVLHWNYEA